MPTYCCGVCKFWLAPVAMQPKGKAGLHGWCQHPDQEEETDIDQSGGIAPYRDNEGGGDLRTIESHSCCRFQLIDLRKPRRAGSD